MKNNFLRSVGITAVVLLVFTIVLLILALPPLLSVGGPNTITGRVVSFGTPFSENSYGYNTIHPRCGSEGHFNGVTFADTYVIEGQTGRYAIYLNGYHTCELGVYGDIVKSLGKPVLFSPDSLSFITFGLNTTPIFCINGRTCRTIPYWLQITIYLIILIFLGILFWKSKDRKSKKAWLAGILNMIFPGFAHFLLGNWKKSVYTFVIASIIFLIGNVIRAVLALIGIYITPLLNVLAILGMIYLFWVGYSVTPISGKKESST